MSISNEIVAQLIDCSAHVDLQHHLGNKASAFVSFAGEAARDLEAGETAREESTIKISKISKISKIINAIHTWIIT